MVDHSLPLIKEELPVAPSYMPVRCAVMTLDCHHDAYKDDQEYYDVKGMHLPAVRHLLHNH